MRGECTVGTHRMSYKEGSYFSQCLTSPRLRNITDPLHTEKYKEQLRQNEAAEEYLPDEGTR